MVDDLVDGEGAGFGGNLAVEDDLEQDIPELFLEFGIVPVVDGLQDFIGFFK